MATTKKPPGSTNVRASVDTTTHKALRARQFAMEKRTDVRPHLTEVVAVALKEWAENQPQ